MIEIIQNSITQCVKTTLNKKFASRRIIAY